MRFVLQNWSIKPTDSNYDAEIEKLRRILSNTPAAELVRVGYASAVVEVKAPTATSLKAAWADLQKSLEPNGWKVYESSSYGLP